MKHRPEIDGLRAIAVLPVIFFHAGLEVFSGGFVGVDVFFVISGFLITSILLSDMDRDSYSLLTFYERRARRILPALIFVILSALPFAWVVLLPADLHDFGQSVLASMTFSSNILFWREIDYFETAAEFKPLLHTWSLAIEEQFYILFPPLLALVVYRLKPLLLPILVVLALGSLMLAQIGTPISPSATFFLLPTRGWELLIGCLAAILMYREKVPLHMHSWNQGLSAFGIFLIFGSIFLIDENIPFPGIYAFPATLGTVLVLLFTQPATLAYRMLAMPIFVGIGLISYSAYLWHQPLIAFLRYRYPMFEHGTLLMGLLALFFGWISWKFVESPFRDKRFLPGRTSCLTASIIGLVVIGALGGALTWDQGWQTRYSPKEQVVFAAFKDGKDYVPARFNALLGKPFPKGSDHENILIIGDSYGQDLVNAMYEAGLSDRYNLATHHISARCGNLMIEDLTRYQNPEDRDRCESAEGYSAPGLIEKMNAADQIWLVSSWNDWSAPLLEQSLTSIAEVTNNPVTVFGRKHFGFRALRDYHVSGLDALIGQKKVPANLAEVHRWMAAQIPALTRYVDLQLLMCDSHYTCRNNNGQGHPLSFDGTHLTPAGAFFMGQKLDGII